MSEEYKLESVTVENVLRVSFASIDFKDDIVVIGGNHGAGKTSIAKSLFMALGGKEEVPAVPVHGDAVEGTIKAVLRRIDLEGGLVLTARVKPDRSWELVLEDRDGEPVKRPQEKLDTFNAHYGLFPEDFLNQDPKQQREMLIKLAGVDVDSFKRAHDDAYTRRENVNRDLRREKARLEAMPRHQALPDEETSVKDVLAEIEVEQGKAAKKKKLLDDAAQCRGEAVSAQKEIGFLDDKIRAMRDAIIELERQRQKWVDDIPEYERRAVLMEDQAAAIVFDVDAAKARASVVEDTNRKIREKKARDVLAAEVEDLQRRSDMLTAKIKAIAEDKDVAVRSAKFPVDGLGFDDAGATFNGLPLDQASDAVRWKTAIAIGFAMKPKLKLVYVRNGSLMVPEFRAEVYRMVRELGGQLLFEIAGDGPDVNVVMVDGEVGELRTAPPQISET